MPINSLLTIFSSIFLLILLPAIAPAMPKIIILKRIGQETLGTDLVITVWIRLVACEKKIMNNEFWAACLVNMEKKNWRTTILIGPPPIPKNDDKKPNPLPIAMMVNVEVTFKVFILSFLIV